MHPYPGLRPFARDETYIFFGREAHTHELVRILARTRLLAVTGNSGSGKSSIVRTGLLDALDRGLMHEAGSDWRLADLRPGEAPVERLAEAMLEALGFERFEGDVGLTAAMLARGPSSLAELVRQARIATDNPLPEDANVLILVDQFEELFRFADQGGQEQAERFIGLLLAATQQRTLPLYVVITMRSDYLGDCGRFEGLAEAINRGQFLTPRMTREQTVSAIEGPAAVFGAEFDPRLVNELVNDMGARQDRLPLLQHALNLLWERASARAGESGSVAITLDDYRELGGLEAALNAHAERVFDSLSPRQQEIAQALFRQLTEGRGRAGDLRRPTRASVVCAIAGCSLAELAAVVEEFRSPGRSFLMPPAGTPITPSTVLDISHESLIRGWKALSDWTRLEQESAERFRRTLQRAIEHQANRSTLLAGADLAVASEWLQRERPSPAWAERYGESAADLQRMVEFLAESQQAADLAERRRRRGRVLGYVLPTVFAVIAVFVFFLWRQQGELETANQELQAKQGELQVKQAELELANVNLESQRQELDWQNDQLVAQGAKLAAISEAVQSYRDEILSSYQDYVAEASRDARLVGDKDWRRLLTLGWPNRLDGDAERRVSERAVTAMPVGYRIQLLLSEIGLQKGALATEAQISSLSRTLIDASVVVDSTGRWLAAIVDEFGGLFIADLQRGRVARLRSGQLLDGLAATPDGRFLFTQIERGLVVLHPTPDLLGEFALSNELEVLNGRTDLSGLLVDEPRRRLLALEYSGDVLEFAWPPAGEPLRYLRQADGMVAMPLEVGDLWSTTPPEEVGLEQYPTRPLLLDDGRLLLSLNSDGALWLWNLEAGGWAAGSQETGISDFAVSADGRLLVFAGGASNGDAIQVYDLASGGKLAEYDSYYELDSLFVSALIDMRVAQVGGGLELQLLEPRGVWRIPLAAAENPLNFDKAVLDPAEGTVSLGVLGYPHAVQQFGETGSYRLIDFAAAANPPQHAAATPGAKIEVAIAPGGLRAAEMQDGALRFLHLRQDMPHADWPRSYEASAAASELACLRGTIVDMDLAEGDGALLALVRDALQADQLRLCLFWERDGSVVGGEAKVLRGEAKADTLAALSPDGRHLAVLEGNRLGLWRLRQGQAVGGEAEQVTRGEAEATGRCAAYQNGTPGPDEGDAADQGQSKGGNYSSHQLDGGWVLQPVCHLDEQAIVAAQDLVLSNGAASVVVALQRDVLHWSKELSGVMTKLELPDFGGAGPSRLALSKGGEHLLFVRNGAAELVDLCSRSRVHSFETTDYVRRGGFFGSSADACGSGPRHSDVWLIDDNDLISRWRVRQEGLSSRTAAEFHWLLLAERPNHVEAIAEDLGEVSPWAAFAAKDQGVRLAQGKLVTLPSEVAELRDLVDVLLATAPLSAAQGKSKVFELPPAAAVGGEGGAELQNVASACLEWADAAVERPDKEETLRRAEELCAGAVTSGPVAAPVATAYARVLLGRRMDTQAEDLLLLAAAAGDRLALWQLAALYRQRLGADVAEVQFQAVGDADPLASWDPVLGLQEEDQEEDDGQIAESELLTWARQGDAFAALALGRRALEDGDRIEAFRRLSQAQFGLNRFPSQDVATLLAEVDAERFDLTRKISGREALAAVWRQVLADLGDQRVVGADMTFSGAVLYPPAGEQREQALLVAVGHLARNAALAPVFGDLYLSRSLAVVPDDAADAGRMFEGIAVALRAADRPDMLLNGVVAGPELVQRIAHLSQVAFADRAAAATLLTERLAAWLEASARDAGWQANGIFQVRAFWEFAIEVQRLALAEGQGAAVAASLPALLRWAERSGDVFGGFKVSGEDLADLLAEMRGILEGTDDPGLSAMADAFAFALTAWHVDPPAGSYEIDLALTQRLLDRLAQVPESEALPLASLIASRRFGVDGSPALYLPQWRSDENGEAIVDASLLADATAIASVVAWARQRVSDPILTESFGFIRSWQGTSLAELATTADEHLRTGDFRLDSARAYRELAQSDPSSVDYPTWASWLYGSALSDYLGARDRARVEALLAEVIAFIESLPPAHESLSAVLPEFYVALFGDFSEELSYPWLLALYTEYDDRMMAERSAVIAEPEVAYERHRGYLALLSIAGERLDALSAKASAGAPPTECDRASYAYDPMRVAPWVVLEKIPAETIDQCRAAMARYPGELRFMHLLARSLAAEAGRLSSEELSEAERTKGEELRQQSLALYFEAARRDYIASFMTIGYLLNEADRQDLAAPFMQAASERTLRDFGATIAARLLQQGDGRLAQAARRLLTDATALGDPAAALLLATAIAEDRLPAEMPSEAYRLALIAAAGFARTGDGEREAAAALLAEDLAASLTPAERATADAEAAGFLPRPLPTVDFDQAWEILHQKREVL